MGFAIHIPGWARCCGVLLLAAAFGPAFAQNPSPGELPRVLKNIPPATGVCSREEIERAGPVSRTAARKALAPDLACAISAPELFPAGKRADAVFVDTRQASEYDKFRIDGALR